MKLKVTIRFLNLIMALFIGLIHVPSIYATDFYVTLNGDDTNAGSLASPFRTIQHAADLMIAGDTCYIREGVYRESIRPANSGTSVSHISFKPYASENVVISGCDVVNGWLAHEGAGTPFTLEAEDYSNMSGILNAGQIIGSCDNNDWIMFQNINLGDGGTALSVSLAVPEAYAGQTVEFRLDSANGTLIGTLTTSSTGSFTTFEEQTTTLNAVDGIHDIYCVFKGTYGIGSFDWFRFTPYDNCSRQASTNFGNIKLEAEDYGTMSGIMKFEDVIGSCDNNDWIMFKNINLGYGFARIKANLAVPDAYAGQDIEFRLGSVSGTLVGTLTTNSTGSFTTFEEQTTTLSGAEGIHDLYCVFKGTYGIGSFDWFQLEHPKISQVFVNGKRINEARFPNQPVKATMLSKDYWAPVTATWSNGYGHLVVEGASRGTDYWKGCRVVALCGLQWVALTGDVVASTGNNLLISNLSSNWYGSASTYLGSGYGYIIGEASGVDTAGEWGAESDSDILTVWAPEAIDPATTMVEARTRHVGMDLTSLSYIDIEGLNFKACTIDLSNANYCSVDACTVRYPRPFFVWGDGWTRSNDIAPADWVGTGIMVSGANNTISDTYVAHSWGDGVSIAGTGNILSNCIVEDTNWSATDCASISARGSSHDINNNTLRESGRCIIVHRLLASSTITYNDIYNGGILTHDQGLTYTCLDDESTTTIAYNWIHDSHDGSAIYLDNYSDHYLIHHNVIWRSDIGILLSSDNDDIDIFNNTIGEDVSRPMNIGTIYGESTDVVTWNNLAHRVAGVFRNTDEFQGTSLQNNLSASLDYFTDITCGDYSLLSGSPAINVGRVISEITDGYYDTYPDIGAYEYGITAWTPGANLTIPLFEDSIPSTPSNVYGEGISSSIVELKWNDETGLADEYIIRYRYEVIGQAYEATKTVSSTTTQINIGQTICSFEFEVQAISDKGSSPFCRTVSIPISGNGILEAESCDDMSGVLYGGYIIGSCDNNDWVMFEDVNLGTGFSTMRARLAVPSAYAGQTVEIRLDSATGTLIGSLVTNSTDSFTDFEQQTTSITGGIGTHDIYFVFKGSYGIANLDWFRFEN